MVIGKTLHNIPMASSKIHHLRPPPQPSPNRLHFNTISQDDINDIQVTTFTYSNTK
jgi:hypothetical protein